MSAPWGQHRSALQWASLGVLLVYFVVFTVQYANVLDIFLPEATRFSRVLQLAVVTLFLLIGAARARAEVLLGGAAILTLAGYHVLFTVQSGIAPNFNTLLGYVGILAFVPIALIDVPLRTQLRLLFFVSLAYVVFYVAANDMLVAAARTMRDPVGGVIDSGDDRGTRVMIAALSVAYVAFYAIEDRRLPVALRVACIALAIASVWLSNSRTFILVFAVILAVRLLRLNTRIVMLGLLGVFLIVCGIHLYGVFDSGWNPYLYVFKDKSGMGRYVQYGQAVEAIRHHPLFGIGIEPDGTAMAEYLKVPRRWGSVFWGDLGIIGPLGQFGIPGMLLFLHASIAALLSASIKSRDPGLNAVRITCALSALYGVIAPSILWPPHCFFTAVLFGAWLRRRSLGGSERPGTVRGDLAAQPAA